MTHPDYNQLYPYEPGARPEQYHGIEKLRAIEEPWLRQKVIALHKAGAYGKPRECDPRPTPVRDWVDPNGTRYP